MLSALPSAPRFSRSSLSADAVRAIVCALGLCVWKNTFGLVQVIKHARSRAVTSARKWWKAPRDAGQHCAIAWNMVEGLSVHVDCGRSGVGGQQRDEEEQRRGVDHRHK